MPSLNPFFPFHSESDRDYHAWVGLYVGNWSSLEYCLFYLLSVLGRLGLEQNPIPNKSVPLGKKLDTLKRMFANNPALSGEAAELAAIAEFIAVESNFRHNLIHGVNAEKFKVDPWRSLMYRPELIEHVAESGAVLAITQPDIEDHYHKVGSAVFGIMAICSRLLSAAGK